MAQHAKKAICIGINDYPGTGSDLAGCVNDAQDWAETLDGRGFEVTTILDGEATRDTMLKVMHDLVSSASPGDRIVLTYSGHGTWVPDDSGDEKDHRDEALCPHDLQAAGPILDDDLYEMFMDRERGVRVVLVSDSCHSGTLARLAPPIGDGVGTVRFLPPETFLGGAALARAERAARAPIRGTARHSALIVAGCQDTEYSYDAQFDGRPNGAFTYVACQTLKKLKPKATYADWMRAIRTMLPSAAYPQTPRLDAARFQRAWPVLD
ncbi:MAG: caspase family protein [Actinomycetes bacterium]